jgi:hypothetical protein
MGRGERQRYGSQIGWDEEKGQNYLHPLEDVDRVDEWRAAMGLQPLAQYLERFGMRWDPAAYKEALPALEQRLAR